MSGKNKIAIIGLDGATFRVLRPLVDAGVMPTIARFMHEGAWGTLRTTRPPVTCPAWPTMFTGVNPGKHGVFSFSHRDPANGRVRTAASSDVRAPKLWDILGDAGKRSTILNAPITFPAEKLNGAMLTGFVSPDDSPYITYPPPLAARMREQFSDLAMNWSVLGYRPAEPDKREAHIVKINELMMLRAREFEYLIETNPADFYFLVHEYTDRVHHLFYHILDPEYPAHGETKNNRSRQLLYDGHRALDDSIARLYKRLGEDTNHLIVSDHGFDGVTRWVYVNNLLEQHGLVRLKRVKAWADVLSRRLDVSVETRRRLGLEHTESWHRQDPCRAPLIDFSRSRSFAGPQLEHAVYVNVRGRCPNGIVDPGEEYEQVKGEIIRILSEATDPDSGRRVFEGVWPREELYDGPYLENAPDIVFELAPGYMTSNAILPPGLLRGRFLRPLREGWDISGYHRPEGVFVGFGPAFRHAENLDLSILDIAPTVLYLMDLPIPGYMDGQIAREAFRSDLLDRRPQRDCEVDPVYVSRGESAYTEAEQMEVTRRLEELGYL